MTGQRGILDRIRDILESIWNSNLGKVYTERVTGQSGFRTSLTIVSGFTYEIPSYEELIIPDNVYVQGNLYVKGKLEVI
jgi:hypothetical protein